MDSTSLCRNDNAKLKFALCILTIVLFFHSGIKPVSAQTSTKPNETGPLPGIYVNTYNGNLFFKKEFYRIPGRNKNEINV